MPKEDTGIDWKTVALIGTPVALLGLAGAYIYYSRSSKDETTKVSAEKEKVVSDRQPGNLTGTDSGTENEDPLQRSVAYKNRGNKLFKAGRYAQAVECYTKALDVCPTENKEERATFFQNRAAAHENIKQYTDCLADCDSALELSPRYVKAFSRRARILEILERVEECLEDITAVCILEGFSNQENLKRADRVLKLVGKKKADEEMLNIVPGLPSDAFVKAYFSSFSNDPFHSAAGMKRLWTASPSTLPGSSFTDLFDSAPPVASGEEGGGDSPVDNNNGVSSAERGEESAGAEQGARDALKEAEVLLRKGKFEASQKEVRRAIDLLSAHSTTCGTELARARLLWGTYRVLRGETVEAIADFDYIIKSSSAERDVTVNALIKRASLHMTVDQDLKACMDLFKHAIEVWPDCSDIFHHRGQINLLADNLEQALQDLDKAVNLNPDFSITQSQRLYTKFRIQMMSMQNSEAVSTLDDFLALAQRFPLCMETHSLLGQSLVEQGRFTEAQDEFNKVVKLNPSSGTAYVHMGLLELRSKNDVDKAIELMEKAAQVDPKCEFAYEMLATVCVQRGDFNKAMTYFTKAINLTKTPGELAHLVSLREAVVAQTKVCSRYGITINEMMAAGAMMPQM